MKLATELCSCCVIYCFLNGEHFKYHKWVTHSLSTFCFSQTHKNYYFLILWWETDSLGTQFKTSIWLLSVIIHLCLDSHAETTKAFNIITVTASDEFSLILLELKTKLNKKIPFSIFQYMKNLMSDILTSIQKSKDMEE